MQTTTELRDAPLHRSPWSHARKWLSAPLRAPLARALTAPLVAPRTLDDYLELVDPCWSLDRIRARVVGVVHETDDVTSLLLAPNENWRTHRPGQHVLFTVEIDGVQHTRSFSLSRAPRTGAPLRVTIKSHARGCVSAWAHDRAHVGDVVTLSAPRGDFVLPDPVPARLLFVSGGSGMTPLVAMAQALAARCDGTDLAWIHSDRAEAPLEGDLHEVLAAIPRAKLWVHRSLQAPHEPERYLLASQVVEWVPDWMEREAFVCGPRGLMDLVEGLYVSGGRAVQFHSEDYQPRLQARTARPRLVGAAGRLSFVRSGREAEAQAGVTLLEQAERAGLHPQHGCRRGICLTCKCRKLSGAVRNELTGQTSDAPDEDIQLCIHSPEGDVRLDL